MTERSSGDARHQSRLHGLVNAILMARIPTCDQRGVRQSNTWWLFNGLEDLALADATAIRDQRSVRQSNTWTCCHGQPVLFLEPLDSQTLQGAASKGT